MKTKKSILFLTITFFLCLVKSFSQDDNLLVWNEKYKLKKEDFKGVKEKSKLYTTGAKSFINIEYIHVKEKNVNFHYVICVFFKDKSYLVKTISNTLDHEQIHFDIGELFARKIRKEFSELKKAGIQDIQKYNKLFRELHSKFKIYNNIFDAETSFSADYVRHNEWRIRITKELLVLKDYASHKV